ncbi:MAG: hypothetical protein HPY55_08480 [Firmicutes bacterium]|nr:hypothetical protein [Bacillota bacterium]
MNWDLRNYHFYNGYAIMTGRVSKDYAPAQLQTFLNPFLDILHYSLIRWLPPKVAGFILGAVHGINLYLLFIISLWVLPIKRVPKQIVSLMCAILGMYAPTAVSEVGTTMGDLTLSPLVLGGLYYLLKSCSNPRESAKWLLFSGFLFGSAAGTKLTFSPYVVAAAIALLIVHRNTHLPTNDGLVYARTFLLFAAGSALGFVLTDGYWAILLYTHFKNPFFPFFNQLFKSPYALPTSCRDLRWLPKTVGEYLMLPFSFVGLGPHRILELPFNAIRFPLALVLTVVYAMMSCWTRMRKKDCTTANEFNLLLTFFVVSVSIWAAIFSYYRYLAPLELMAPLLIVLLIFHVFSTSKSRCLSVSLAFLLMVGTMKAPNWGRLPWRDSNYFGTSVPLIPGLKEGTVIMTSYSPTAFLLPSFPVETRFVRVQSNFDPAASEKWQREIRDVLTSHSGPFFLLTTKDGFQEASSILRGYGFMPIQERCAEITNCLEPVDLYELRRINLNN